MNDNFEMGTVDVHKIDHALNFDCQQKRVLKIK